MSTPLPLVHRMRGRLVCSPQYTQKAVPPEDDEEDEEDEESSTTSTGIHTNSIGRTTCHQPGQRAHRQLTLSVINVHEDDKVDIDRHVLDVG